MLNSETIFSKMTKKCSKNYKSPVNTSITLSFFVFYLNKNFLYSLIKYYKQVLKFLLTILVCFT